MKKINFKKIIFTAMFFSSVITSMAQSKEAKKAIEEAKIFFVDSDYLISMDTNLPVEQFGYLLPAPNELVAEEKDGLSFDTHKISFIPPGTYTFGYRRITYAKGMTTGNQVTQGNVTVSTSYTQSNRIESKLLPVDAVIEAGKYYTTEYEIIRTKGFFKADSIAVSITELTDPELILKAQNSLIEEREMIRKFLHFQEQNPTRLEGKWLLVNSPPLRKKEFLQYSFEGEKFKYKLSQGKSIENSKLLGETESHIFYSENIITFVIEKASLRGKELKNLNTEPDICYYTIINDELHLQKKGIKTFPRIFGGKFKRD